MGKNILIEIYILLRKYSRTRRHEAALVKDQCRLGNRKYFFSHTIINDWNKLSTDYVNASSVNMFKNKVDKYLWRYTMLHVGENFSDSR